MHCLKNFNAKYIIYWVGGEGLAVKSRTWSGEGERIGGVLKKSQKRMLVWVGSRTVNKEKKK